MKPWTDTDDAKMRKMAGSGWSVHMVAAQLDRIPYDVETRAEVLGLKLADRTAGRDSTCAKCNRSAGEDCPYHVNYCPRTAPFRAGDLP